MPRSFPESSGRPVSQARSDHPCSARHKEQGCYCEGRPGRLCNKRTPCLDRATLAESLRSRTGFSRQTARNGSLSSAWRLRALLLRRVRQFRRLRRPCRDRQRLLCLRRRDSSQTPACILLTISDNFGVAFWKQTEYSKPVVENGNKCIGGLAVVASRAEATEALIGVFWHTQLTTAAKRDSPGSFGAGNF